ncbi:GAF and ANTAR domain-containing protein [Arthrobacter sp. Sr33]
MASTSYESHLVEALQLKHGAGPCVDCYTTGTPITIRDIAGTEHRWPEFSDAAKSQGFRSAHAFPMRLQGRTIGAMNLFRTNAGKIPDEDIAIGQALTDVATINLLQKRTAMQTAITSEQLREALGSRILIEQAKGMIDHGQNIHTNTAFHRLRTYSRAHSRNLHLNRILTV